MRHSPTMRGDDDAVLGDGDAQIGYALRLYYKPLISWIWGGAALMAVGGLIACFAGMYCQTPNVVITGIAGSGSHIPAASLSKGGKG